MVKKRAIRTFAPFRYATSALRTFTRGQAIFLLLLLAACVIGLILFKVGMLVGLIAGVTAFYIIDLSLTLILSIRALGYSGEEGG